ncbi:L-histidine N(alpha)-methyltransferase [Methylocystis sp. MJC1]|jgi:dimethylhistidine N-methyltransferase|uniref:L-histidine N(alpha)-methyltransferase n=1 Tax=Methylocystis sp. MJC1 TaxID=2654282 RepID=UPI0013ED6A1F|nr:L-histidine N(alpha)-methyltransferase [Methylocystis sp. MJC1]KAF2992508.1 Histidine N-alpha-methyltransferase [Methylocystis sp. MJC1]MBU6526484.1 L-histidine N(alpha)-methyltransferase [Methylocystis sp. MJC1]UZX12924.1 L-histidine N(alpha)-methyltransferase [Methylocystis sp. MJC1]
MPERAEHAFAPAQKDDDFAASVFDGLSRPLKSLPCRFFYDSIGSALFEEITRQPEYYLTRAEIAILEANAPEMLGGELSGGILIEFGSGSSIKTEILIRLMPRLRAYVPIDISESALLEAKRRLTSRFPRLDVRPILGDFSHPVALPPEFERLPKLGFFPGSTIGNFPPAEAAQMLRMMRLTLSSGGRLLIGVDLKKDARQLVRAYNDAKGFTAAFNLNLLARINRELGGTFDLNAFRHRATYEPLEGRITMHLVSTKEQAVELDGARIQFSEGETIHTESAYKYTIDEFRRVSRSAGWLPQRVWTDPDNLFSVRELV